MDKKWCYSGISGNLEFLSTDWSHDAELCNVLRSVTWSLDKMLVCGPLNQEETELVIQMTTDSKRSLTVFELGGLGM